MAPRAPAADAPSEALALPAWTRFLAPYYVCNVMTLLMYVPIRYQRSSEALMERDNMFQIPLVWTRVCVLISVHR